MGAGSSENNYMKQGHLKLTLSSTIKKPQIQLKTEFIPEEYNKHIQNSNLMTLNPKSSRINSENYSGAANEITENENIKMKNSNLKVSFNKINVEREKENPGKTFFNKNNRSEDNSKNDFYNFLGQKPKKFTLKEISNKENFKNINDLKNIKEENPNRIKINFGNYKINENKTNKDNIFESGKIKGNKTKNIEKINSEFIENTDEETENMQTNKILKNDIYNNEMNNITIKIQRKKSDKSIVKENINKEFIPNNDLNKNDENDSYSSKEFIDDNDIKKDDESELYTNKEFINDNDINKEDESQLYAGDEFINDDDLKKYDEKKISINKEFIKESYLNKDNEEKLNKSKEFIFNNDVNKNDEKKSSINEEFISDNNLNKNDKKKLRTNKEFISYNNVNKNDEKKLSTNKEFTNDNNKSETKIKQKSSINKKNDEDDDDKKSSCSNLNCVEKQRNNVFYNMYLSNVYNRLREIDNCSDVDAQRWPYELLQNAKDSISGDKTRSSVNIEFNIQNDFVNICHDGSPFNTKQFYALLYKYSEGKDKNNSESTGRFGTGFMTTHLLSKTVRIEGPLYDDDNGNKIIGFLVTMYREGITKEELLKGLERTEKEKKFYPNKQPKLTKYTYILKTERNHSASILGYNNLKINVFLTMVFNKIFNSITIQYQKEKYIYTNKSITNKDVGDNIKIFDFEFYDEVNNKTLKKKYLYTKYKQFSEILSKRFDLKRDLTIEACIEVDSNKNILVDERSPCLFCSLPLVGSELHVLPLILNSNDFEPSTERQEILLDGDDEHEKTKIPTDVGVNKSILITSMQLYKNMVEFASKNKYKNLHYFVRGINEMPKQKKYFDKKWYKKKFIIPMREIIYKIPIIYINDEKLDYIKNIYFPIYDDVDNETFYYVSKELFIKVPEYKTSLQWSKYIWDEDMERNKITIEKLVDKFVAKKYSVKFTNDFIKFIWDNYKEIPPKKELLMNQNKEYVKYNENIFYQDVNVSEEIINCLEDLGHEWRKYHLHKCITSIELPVKHSMKEAIHFIKDKIKEDEKKSFTLCKYINKIDAHRNSVYYFTKKYLNKDIKKQIYVSFFNKEIYTECDKYLIGNITKYVEARGIVDDINITSSDYERLLQFLYNYYGGEDIFNRKKLLLSEDGKFEFLHKLKKNVNIPLEIINKTKDYLGLNLNKILISEKIKNLNINIKKYSMDDFMLEINPKLLLEETDQADKENMAKLLLQYVPKVNSGENSLATEQLKMQKKIRQIYEVFTGYTIDEKQIETNYEFFWANSNKIIIDLCQKTAQTKGNLDNYSENYIEILNEYGKWFDFEKYAIIPNKNGTFKKASELKDYCDIDDELVNGLINNYNNLEGVSLDENILNKSVKLDIIRKETISEFGNLLYDNMPKANPKNNLEMSKILIKFIPKKAEYSKKQTKLYNMYKYFEKLGDVKQIEKCQLLFDLLKPAIVHDILERINKYGNLETINKIVKDYFVFINTNHDILEIFKNVYDKFKIIPNQNGVFKYGKELKKDNGLCPELRDLINEYGKEDEKFALKNVLMHKSITFYNPTEHINNDQLVPLVNDLLSKGFLKPEKILEFVPVEKKAKETQEKLRFIYENLYNKKLKKIVINLPLLWEKANNLLVNNYLKKIEKQQLKLLNNDENVALKILETFYEFISPELKDNSNLQIVPNYYGELKAYNELREPNNLSENFIEMMKKNFDHDIRKYLRNDKIKFKIVHKFEFSKDICNIINDKLKGFGSEQIARAKELIKFYPSSNNEKILNFIYCYKILGKKEFEEEPVETNNASLWDNAKIILLKDLIDYFKNDKNLANLCTRTGKKEAVIIETLNKYYHFYYYYVGEKKLEYEDLWLPNCYGEFRKFNNLGKNEGISDQLKKILKLLDEKKDYNKILLHEKIKLDFYEKLKKVKDILKEINEKVKELYDYYQENKNKITLRNDNRINENSESKGYENFKEACSLLLKKWGPNHLDKYENKLTYVFTHKLDIIMHVILDEDVQQRYEEGLNKDPEDLINYMNGFSLKKQLVMDDNHNYNYNYNDQVKQLDLLYGGRRVNVNEYIDQIQENNNSTNVDLDYYANEFLRNNKISDEFMELFNNLMGNKIDDDDNNNYINNDFINKNIKFNNDPVHNFVRSVRINRTIVNNINNHTVNNYYIAQAYVYEYFQKFDNLTVTWENLIRDNNNVNGAITVKIPSNNHSYRIIDKELGHDLIIETLNGKKFKIKVRYSLGTDNFYDFLVQNKTWSLLNDSNEFFMAFVSLKDISDPQIIICSRIDLKDLIMSNIS